MENTMTPTPGVPLSAEGDCRVGDYAVRLEDHPLVKAGEVHRVTETFRGGYLGFAPPIGGEWNPNKWRKCDAEGWMTWSGGENPADRHTVVDIRRRDGTDVVGAAFKFDWLHSPRRNDGDDIIAFRLTTPSDQGEATKLETCPACDRLKVMGCRCDFNTTPASGSDGLETVGEAGTMAGSNGGFTMAAFKASVVPVGTALVTREAAEKRIGELEAEAYQIASQANRLNDEKNALQSQVAALKAALERFLPYAQAEYVPNVLFDEARSVLQALALKEGR